MSKVNQTAIPLESSEEAASAIGNMLKEYNYPANPTNAARAGWRAARLYGIDPLTLGAVSDDYLRREWAEAGGEIHGPRVETVTMPEKEYLEFRRSLNPDTVVPAMADRQGFMPKYLATMEAQLAASQAALRAAQAFILRAYNWDSDGPGKYPTLHAIALALGEPIVERIEGSDPL